MRKTLLFFGGLFWLVCAAAPALAQSPLPSELTLPQALQLALAHNPGLAAAAAEVQIKNGEGRQAGLRPNPELSLELENFAGQGELRGTDGAEAILQLSQLVELGGKRSQRLQLAAREQAIAEQELLAQRLELTASTRKAFVQLLAAQQGLALAEEQVRLAEGVFATVEARVSGGKVPAVERQRAEVALAVTRSAAVQASLALSGAQQELALQWGGVEPLTPKAVGTLEGLAELPTLATLTARLDQSPEAARWQQQAAASQDRIALAQRRSALAYGHAALVAAHGQAGVLREQVLPAAQLASTPQPAGEAGTPLPGQVVFNRNRLARLTPQLSGVVKKIHVTLGQQVKAGQLLAELAAPEVAAMRASLVTSQSRQQLAEANYLREQELLAKGVSSRLEFEQAEAERRQAQSAVTQARQQLQDHGVDAATLKGLSGSTLAVRAPFAGTVTEIASIAGEAVGLENSLLTLADLITLWVELSVPEDRLLDLQTGAGVNLAFASLPGRAFTGKVFWVAPALDEKTRMLKALAEVDNRDGLLKSGLFGEARLAGKSSARALAVPADALQTIDGQPYLFIELEPDLFEIRRVETAGRTRGAVLISLGLTPADRVVTAQGFALKSELLKSRLGASCADH